MAEPGHRDRPGAPSGTPGTSGTGPDGRPARPRVSTPPRITGRLAGGGDHARLRVGEPPVHGVRRPVRDRPHRAVPAPRAAGRPNRRGRGERRPRDQEHRRKRGADAPRKPRVVDHELDGGLDGDHGAAWPRPARAHRPPAQAQRDRRRDHRGPRRRVEPARRRSRPAGGRARRHAGGVLRGHRPRGGRGPRDSPRRQVRRRAAPPHDPVDRRRRRRCLRRRLRDRVVVRPLVAARTARFALPETARGLVANCGALFGPLVRCR